MSQSTLWFTMQIKTQLKTWKIAPNKQKHEKNNLKQKHKRKPKREENIIPGQNLGSCSAVMPASPVKCSITAPRYALQDNFAFYERKISCEIHIINACENEDFISTKTRGIMPIWSHRKWCGVPQGWPAHWVWVLRCLALVGCVTGCLVLIKEL